MNFLQGDEHGGKLRGHIRDRSEVHHVRKSFLPIHRRPRRCAERFLPVMSLRGKDGETLRCIPALKYVLFDTLHVRPQMPKNIEPMPAFPFNDIPYEIETIFHRPHPPSVHDRLRQPLVAVVAGHQEIESWALNPLLGLSLCEPLP